MPSRQGYAVWITVDGTRLEEYGTEVVDDRTVTCYVPSSSGQTFRLQVSSPHTSTHTTAFSVSVDGHRVVGQFCKPGSTCTIKGVDVTSTSYRELKFGEISLTDDDSFLDRSSLEAQDLGCISVVVRRVKHKIPRTKFTDRSKLIADGPIHERSKKAGAHRVTMGAAKSCPPIRKCKTTYFETYDCPLFKFNILYRPEALLQAEGIMPLPPASNASPQNRGRNKGLNDVPPPSNIAGPSSHIIKNEVESVDDDFEIRLAAKEERVKALQAEMEQARAEVAAERSQMRVKREVSPIRVPSSSNSRKRIVIDLTSD